MYSSIQFIYFAKIQLQRSAVFCLSQQLQAYGKMLNVISAWSSYTNVLLNMVEMVLCLVLIYLRLCVSWLYTSFKWEHSLAPLSHSNDIFVLFCVEMSVYFQHFSVHMKADRNKPRRQRLCQSGWIILKRSWCIYSSFQSLQNKPFFPFPAFKKWKEIYFQPFQPDTLLLVLGSHLWPSSSAPAASCLEAKP